MSKTNEWAKEKSRKRRQSADAIRKQPSQPKREPAARSRSSLQSQSQSNQAEPSRADLGWAELYAQPVYIWRPLNTQRKTQQLPRKDILIVVLAAWKTLRIVNRAYVCVCVRVLVT